MLSEEEFSVGEIMTRANRRTKQDIKSGMFVALLYAVLDANAGMIRMCSAGQTQPVYLPSKGNSVLLETEGDTFPLGILEDVNYQETQLSVNEGDKIIFYTDGIVEAMNSENEMFGFERLQAVIDAAKHKNAAQTLNEIVQAVTAFAGDTSQHDDITAITVCVIPPVNQQRIVDAR